MTINYFTKYSRTGASSRLRSFQYQEYLEVLGCKVSYIPLFGDDYLENRYLKKFKIHIVLKSYFRRLFTLFKLNRSDVIIVEKELFPYVPFFIERIFYKQNQIYFLDFDDAIFHNYDLHPNPVIRYILRDKSDQLMSRCKNIIVCNSYLERRAKLAGAKKVYRIPTVVDLKRYSLNNFTTSKADKIILGWIGSPSTFKYLKSIEDWLKEAIDKYGIHLYVIGSFEQLNFKKNVSYFEWSEESEVSLLNSIDIGLMPMIDSKWAMGKCAYKLIQYMASGKAVIASPIGMNCEVVEHGINGFLASNCNEFLDAIKKYSDDPKLMQTHGKNGYKKVVEKFSLENTSKKLFKVINDVVNDF